MTDAAQGELTDHEVFNTPNKISTSYQMWTTPKSYSSYPGGDKLPPQLKVWLVQNTGANTDKTSDHIAAMKNNVMGVVLDPVVFVKDNDTEIIAAGYNVAKGNGGVAIGRHKNLMHWGFYASPEKMNENGKKLFINCLTYVMKYAVK